MVYLIIGFLIISVIGYFILKDDNSEIFNFNFILSFLLILSFIINCLTFTMSTSNIYYVTYDIETNKLVESSFMDENSHSFIVENYKSYWTWKDKHKYRTYNHSEMFESKNIDDVKNYINELDNNELDNEDYIPKQW